MVPHYYIYCYLQTTMENCSMQVILNLLRNPHNLSLHHAYRSAWLRFQLLNLRMNRYFRRSTKMEKIRAFIVECKLGDWFVLYQMSKNLNRPFFMDFLTCLSVRYSIRGYDDDTDSDTGQIKHTQKGVKLLVLGCLDLSRI